YEGEFEQSFSLILRQRAGRQTLEQARRDDRTDLHAGGVGALVDAHARRRRIGGADEGQQAGQGGHEMAPKTSSPAPFLLSGGVPATERYQAPERGCGGLVPWCVCGVAVVFAANSPAPARSGGVGVKSRPLWQVQRRQRPAGLLVGPESQDLLGIKEVQLGD